MSLNLIATVAKRRTKSIGRSVSSHWAKILQRRPGDEHFARLCRKDPKTGKSDDMLRAFGDARDNRAANPTPQRESHSTKARRQPRTAHAGAPDAPGSRQVRQDELER